MKILITGANGTIGSDLVIFFSKFYYVYAIYRSSNKITKKIKSKNICWIKHDLSKEINYNIKPNVVIHCAVTHEFKKKNKINDYVESNIISLQNIIKFSNKKKISKFFNFSSFAVYNKNQINILSITKKIAEHIIKNNKINFLNIRLPGVLSYKLSDPRRPWLNYIISELKMNKNISIFNKNFLFNSVIDTYEIFFFLKSQIERKKMKNGTINLIASRPLQLFKLINSIKEKINSKSKVFYKTNKSLENNIIHSSNIVKKTYKFEVATTSKIIDRFLINSKNN